MSQLIVDGRMSIDDCLSLSDNEWRKWVHRDFWVPSLINSGKISCIRFVKLSKDEEGILMKNSRAIKCGKISVDELLLPL